MAQRYNSSSLVHTFNTGDLVSLHIDARLRKLREELEAENSGVQIPAEIRWLGGAKVRARFQEKKEGASSVVAAVLGEATFNRLCRYGVRLLGVWFGLESVTSIPLHAARRAMAAACRCPRDKPPGQTSYIFLRYTHFLPSDQLARS